MLRFVREFLGFGGYGGFNAQGRVTVRIRRLVLPFSASERRRLSGALATFDASVRFFRSSPLFLVVHIDGRHFAVLLLLLFELFTTSVLQKLSLTASRAVYAKNDMTLVLRLHFKVAVNSGSAPLRKQLDSRRQK